jgi:uncharacterized paraquat-inducible protein A
MAKALEKKTHTLKCGKCPDGKVIFELKRYEQETRAEIKRCDKCKHQYYLKEITDNPLEPITEPHRTDSGNEKSALCKTS